MGQLERDKNIKKVPWKSICTSAPVIALLFALVGFLAVYINRGNIMHIHIEQIFTGSG